MTLARQLLAGLSAIFLVLLFGIEATYISSARRALVEQLDAHANETATSLALVLGSRMSSLDASLANTIVNPVFDRGHFSTIEVRSVSGEPVVSRQLPDQESEVPGWFVRLVELEGPSGEALISSGWRQLGKVSVRIHPQYAYRQLWQTATATLAWLAALFAVALVAIRFHLAGILRPLREIERSAIAISNRAFVSIDAPTATRELRRVVDAMNSLSGKVRAAIAEESARADRLRKEAFEDSVTGVLNRRGFEQRAAAFLTEGGEVYEGSIALFSVSGLAAVNSTFGLACGDDILRTLAAAMQAGASGAPVIVGRWQGPTLAALRVDVAVPAALPWARAICAAFPRTLIAQGLPEGVSITAGVGQFNGGSGGTDKIFADAEAALSKAAGSGAGAVAVAPVQASGAVGDLHREIESAISGDRLVLLYQRAISLGGGPIHVELLSRLISENGTPIAAADFVPVASQFGLLPALDIRLIEHALKSADRLAALAPSISLNVSLQSVSDAGFRKTLRDFLNGKPAFAKRLVFEMTGFSASRSPQLTKEFAATLRALGSGLALDQFDLDRDALALVHDLMPVYIKLAPVFTRQIAARADVRFIVEAMVRMLSPLEIPLIAQGVEDAGMIPVLATVGFSGYQGFAAGKPEPLIDS